ASASRSSSTPWWRARKVSALSRLMANGSRVSSSLRNSESSELRPRGGGDVRLEQRQDELVRIERPQILRAFAHPQVADRDPGLLADRDRDPSPRRPVELGEDDPGDPQGLRERPRLRNGVLASGCIENEQRLVWRSGNLARD